MEPDADLRAFDELSRHARIADLASIAAHVMVAAAELRRPNGGAHEVGHLAEEKHLLREDAMTTFGNALDVLARGPTDASERSLGRALAAHALGAQSADAMDDERRAKTILWLATHTPFDVTTLLDRALGGRAAAVWQAFADRVREADSGAPTLDRGEALVAAAALATSGEPAATNLASALATEVLDPKLSFVLRAKQGASAARPLLGEWTPSPRSAVTAVLGGLSGVSFVLHASRILGRIALGYRRPAEVLILDDGGVRITWRVELLGRTLSEHDVLVPPSGLLRATREVRYPRLMLYAALLALVTGSYVGVRALVDGFRAASPSLVVTGLFVVGAGLALDLALTSIAPAARGRCRVLFVPRLGRALRVGSVDMASADALLNRLARGPSASARPATALQRPSDDSMRSPRTASSRPADA